MKNLTIPSLVLLATTTTGCANFDLPETGKPKHPQLSEEPTVSGKTALTAAQVKAVHPILPTCNELHQDLVAMGIPLSDEDECAVLADGVTELCLKKKTKKIKNEDGTKCTVTKAIHLQFKRAKGVKHSSEDSGSFRGTFRFPCIDNDEQHPIARDGLGRPILPENLTESLKSLEKLIQLRGLHGPNPDCEELRFTIIALGDFIGAHMLSDDDTLMLKGNLTEIELEVGFTSEGKINQIAVKFLQPPDIDPAETPGEFRGGMTMDCTLHKPWEGTITGSQPPQN